MWKKIFIYFPYHFSQVDLTSLKQDWENHSAGEMPTYPKRENEIHMMTLTVLQIDMWVKKHRNLKQPNVKFIVYHHKVLIEEGIGVQKKPQNSTKYQPQPKSYSSPWSKPKIICETTAFWTRKVCKNSLKRYLIHVALKTSNKKPSFYLELLKS